jgi:hypothetical protein
VYNEQGKRRLEFAIVDIGCGILTNAHRANIGLEDDNEAITWAFKMGTTSAKKGGDFLPHDPDLACDEQGNHHMGLGLWELHRLIDVTGGTLMIATGNGRQRFSNGNWLKLPGIGWRGLAIEFEISLDVDDSTLIRFDEWTGANPALAEELGL